MIILVLSNNMGGLYSFRKEVLLALKNAGHEIIIGAPYDEKTYLFKDIKFKLIDTKFNRRGMNPLKDVLLMIRYAKILRKTKANLLLSYTIKPNLYGGMASHLCGVPQIANITGLGSAVEKSGWLQHLTIFLYKIGLRYTNTVFFQNEANKLFCEQHRMTKGKVKIIPGSGVNLQHHYLQDYPTSDAPIRFIFISRLLREKGIEEYLSAAQRIRKKYPNTEFHILGRCEEDYEDFVNQLQKENIIIYHGVQIDVRPYIGQCHCTVHPSFYPEGMSNVLLESCAAGRPIITTARPGCGEIVDEGINGFVVKQQDALDLVDKIEKFIILPYEKKKSMGLASRHKVEREFDRQIVVDAYLQEVYNIGHHHV